LPGLTQGRWASPDWAALCEAEQTPTYPLQVVPSSFVELYSMRLGIVLGSPWEVVL
jgi:hypothetical protein